MATWDFIQKQILLGDASTGKSSLLVRLTDDRFLTHSEPTIGVEFGSRVVDLIEGEDKGKRVKLQIWDTAGQESFRSITRSYFRGAGGALLVFDLSSPTSFHSCRSWLAELRQWGEEDLVILVVGNKADFVEEGEGVKDEEVEEWVKEEGLAGFTRTSAKSGSGVAEAFDALTREVHVRQMEARKRNTALNQGSGSSFPLTLGGKGGKGGCC